MEATSIVTLRLFSPEKYENSNQIHAWQSSVSRATLASAGRSDRVVSTRLTSSGQPLLPPISAGTAKLWEARRNTEIRLCRRRFRGRGTAEDS